MSVIPRKRRQRRFVRTRRYMRTLRRRHLATIPLEVATMAVAIPFTPGHDGGDTIAEAIKRGDPAGAAKELVRGLTGFDPNSGSFDIWKSINPLDFSEARYWKMLLYASLMSKIRKRFVKIPMKRVPFVGRYLS